MSPSGCSASAASSSAGRSVTGTGVPSSSTEGWSPRNRSDSARRRAGAVVGLRRVQQVALGQRLDGHLPPVVEPDAVHARLDPHAHRPARVRLAGQDPPGRGDQRARPAAQAREVRHVADPQLLVRDRQAHPQLVLRQLRRGRDQLHHRRVRGVQRAADVDGADQRAGVRVVHGRGRAGPGVDGADQVLGGVDLHRARRRRARCPSRSCRWRLRTSACPARARPSRPRAAGCGAPSRHRIVPSASVTIMTCTASSAMLTSVLRSSGRTAPSGCADRTPSRSAARWTTGGSTAVRVDVGGQAAAPRVGDERARGGAGRRRRRARRRRPRATPGPARPGRWSRRRPTRFACGRRATRLRPRPS